MIPAPATRRASHLAAWLAVLTAWTSSMPAQTAATDSGTNETRIALIQGIVEVLTPGAADWVLTTTNQVLRPHYKLRARPDSRVTIRWSDQSVVSFGQLTMIEILPPHEPGAAKGINLLGGLLSFFHRDSPGHIRVITRGAAAGVKGTEFVVALETNGSERTTLSVIDGTVDFRNEQGGLMVTNGQQAVVELGDAPRRTPGFIVNNVLQWCFYYPAVLDVRDLPLTDREEQTLRESLAAYRAGDLLQALEKYPPAGQPGSDAKRVYHAALLLSVGQVKKTEDMLASLPAGDSSERTQRLAAALRQLIAAVRRQSHSATITPQFSTELLAASYYEQARAVGDPSLKAAYHLAWQAATNSPKFGFAWARVAELEFSFGRSSRALEALNTSLDLSPHNAQALALKGFLLAAQNQVREAITWFDKAIAVDSALANAWLGRGLCRLRRGDLDGGREDLLIAAALEPQRALLRSYLGKAYGNAGDTSRAIHELDLAKGLDPSDPTAWLYSALLNEQNHHLNEGIHDLERSQALYDNRRLYRSRFLLDQDRAVRGASLANIYAKAGMTDVSEREAARAVSYDYANYSSHLFLADSFNALRDPTRFNLRYETSWFNELLLANLLAPVGGTLLSQNVSQQEYSRLFEQNHVGLSSSTEYRSDGQIHELASQFGTVGNTGWSLDLDYQHNDGVRPNNSLDRIEWYSTLKQQITSQDSLLLLTKYQDYHSGDNFQYYDWRQQVKTNFTFDETQSPIVFGAYHREWAPGVHTLLLAGRLVNDQQQNDTPVALWVIAPDTNNQTLARQSPFSVAYQSELEIYSAELNQIINWSRNTAVVGGRYQSGQFDTRSTQVNLDFPFLFPNTNTAAVDDFHHYAVYAYDTLEVVNNLQLTAGVAYDNVRFPRNHRQVPISAGEETRADVGPKAALVWSPISELTLRGAYTRSLGGVSLDESYRLEPVQLAGFSQAFRTLIPESVAGSVSAPRFETAGGALDFKFRTRTYAGLTGEWLRSDVDRSFGVYDYSQGSIPSVIPQHLDFDEYTARINISQPVGREFTFGAQYAFVRDELRLRWPSLELSVNPGVNADRSSDLHFGTLYGLFNHPSGFFARAEANWYAQANLNRTNSVGGQMIESKLPGDDFWQLNFWIGFRLRRGTGAIAFGLLNATDTDYKLDPLNPYTELPHERVFAARLSFRF